MQPDQLPQVSPELLKYLKKTFPFPLPKPKDNVKKVMFDSGCAHVVEHLEHLYQANNPN